MFTRVGRTQLIAANIFFPYVAFVMTIANAYTNSMFDLALLLFIIMTIHFIGGHRGENRLKMQDIT